MEEQQKETTKAPAPSGTSKPARKPRVKRDHPRYSEMIVAALKELKQPRGASRQAISGYIADKFPVPSNSNRYVSVALKSMLAKNSLIQTKGSGASGSFKINKEVVADKTKKAGGKKKKATKKRRSPAKKKRKVTKKRGGKKKRKSPAKRRKPAKKAKRRPAKKAGKRKAKKKPAKRRL
ncbi:histone H5-like [Styela clava]|uniref:histone H1-delta-like n=1 Tax=Styela clava TaxID=7725 RepID=UPI00193AD2D8|nr:histone H1-delta-like [Styela clava]